MRQSEGSLAWIARRRDGRLEVLTQWNRGWGAFSLVGGHRRPSESFAACLAREVAEELGLVAGEGFTIDDGPLARLEYVAPSASAGVETAYTLEVYRVDLANPVAEVTVAADPANRWVTTAEVAAGRSNRGEPISPTVARVLTHLELADLAGSSR